ncbi:MAG: hypothetical protein UT34_C0001G0311 [candidate division WS6 bacterium GW2011_GWF2_39_15]|uniref:Uncharacterized protein n=1 Tax=candidate division WS6 bacterium GW2011_GWF2_39_15 TaxID=1619100 RepID=A0A0G0N0C5_9BACT|nr:MAG: hypothetical protein UT34_C0001G0311 [candidate division WS6 bacterium GW2011_GWF2_39_15]
MKAGPYCGYTLPEIIEIKQKEEKKTGKFFWGYSGVFCHPKTLQNFVLQSISNSKKVYILLTETKSSFETPKVEQFTKYSTDTNHWLNLPEEILLVGNKSRPHFAITGNKLHAVEMNLDISQYCLLNGLLINKDRYLNNYFKYRVDKACGYYSPREDYTEKIIKVNYLAELVSPYSIYIK